MARVILQSYDFHLKATKDRPSVLTFWYPNFTFKF